MQVVERSHQLQFLREQQTIAEHIASHVTNTDDRDRVFLHVDTTLTEMTLHTHPGTLGGNAHAFVVIASRTTRGKGIAQPEAILAGNAIGNVRESRGALVGGHHQIGIVSIMAYHALWLDNLSLAQVIGDIQQTADEQPVAGNRFGEDFIARATWRQTSRHEAPLGAHRHDHRVLHLLGLDQAQHLGAEILLAIRPAQTATRHIAKAQVYAFKAWAVDENLELRYRSGNVRNESRTELETEVGFGLAVGSALEKVAAQGGLDQVQIAPQDAVLVEYRHIVERSENRLLQLMLLVLQVFGRQLARQIKARTE